MQSCTVKNCFWQKKHIWVLDWVDYQVVVVVAVAVAVAVAAVVIFYS